MTSVVAVAVTSVTVLATTISVLMPPHSPANCAVANAQAAASAAPVEAAAALAAVVAVASAAAHRAALQCLLK